MNFGGTKRFVLGHYKSGDELGAHGIDLRTRTVWEVINHTDYFVATAGFRRSKDR
jgi:hypothetical protein